jgi:hypothetical protein
MEMKYKTMLLEFVLVNKDIGWEHMLEIQVTSWSKKNFSINSNEIFKYILGGRG